MLTSQQRDEFKLHCPAGDRLPEFWPTAKPMIQKALDRGSNFTIEDIEKGLHEGYMQLWMWADEAALVTTIQNRDDKTWCLLLAIGGESMDVWIKYLPLVEGWAKRNGCQEMRVYGRIGWAKVIGYDIEWTKMSKRI